jgi:serine/threonine protein kinase, bacterial
MLISSVAPKLPRHPDFMVVDILAAADFGWEYLIRDAAGLWVLEELLPSAETSEDLFTLQAMLTERLHPFRAIANAQLAAIGEVLVVDERLFWRRSYVAGRTYGQLLELATAQDQTFTADAVWDWLEAVLMALAPLHDQGLVHGAIDRNAVVCREADGAIILQRFGDIRAFGLAHHFYPLLPLWGQSTALAGVAQDLADLARLALVLLTGDESIDDVTMILQNRQQPELIGDELVEILTTMLAPKPWRKFRDARDVLQAVQADGAEPAGTAVPQQPHSRFSTKSPIGPDPIVMILAIVLVGLVALAFWRIANTRRIPAATSQPAPPVGKFSGKAAPAATNLAAIVAAPPKLAAQLPEKQGISPELYDRLIGDLPKTEKQPERLINPVLNRLSEEARRELGTYYRRNYDRWFATLASRKVSQPTVDILADTAFYLRFPMLQGQTLNPRTFGQLWYAIARNQITNLNQQKNLKVLTIDDFNESGQLPNGQGRVFQVQIKPGDRLQLSLEANQQDVRLSVIENEIVLTRSSLNTRWTAPQSSRGATYEIILTPLKLDAVPYQLRLQH